MEDLFGKSDYIPFVVDETFSHYKIIKKLGVGGMGEVYLAEDITLNRKVALKFLPPDQTLDPDAKERLTLEAQAAAALNHFHIVTVYEVAEYQNRWFIAMEYVEGKPLKDLIVVEGLPLVRVLDFAVQIGEGLARAHRSGVVHCDIKSDNIFVDPDGRVKILDFGLARLKGSSQNGPAGWTAGTPGYMSPEQAEGGEMDGRTDIFSFGAVLYEMITSRLPFSGTHPAAVLYAILNEAPVAVSKLRPETPAPLREIVNRALAKKKEDRFQSVAEMLAELKRCKEGLEEGRRTEPRKEKKSVAVLFFENMSADPESDYFSAGMTEDIITDLSKVGNLRVASRNAVLPYQGKTVDVRALGKQWNLNAVLQGSVRKAGNRIRISAQLIDAQEGFNLWAERYDRELTEVFELQEEIAKKIAAALKIQLSDRDEEKLALKYKGNLEAYDHYLKGRSYFYKYTKSDLLIAIQMFKKALEVDPEYALAHAGLADSYVQMIDRYYETDAHILKQGEDSAQKALSIDPLCAEAYKALGLVYYKQWRFQKSKEQLLKALDLKPDYAPAASNLASTCLYLGDFERAEKEYLRAYEQDPSLTFVLWLLARLYLSLNRFSLAEAYVKRVLESGESSFYLKIGHYLFSRIFFYQRQFEKALYHMEKYVEVEPDEPFGHSGLASLYAALGRPEPALEKIGKTLKNAPWDEDIIENLILAYAFLGNRGEVYGWIRKGIDQKKILWVFLEYNPLLEGLRSEPDFQRLLEEVKKDTKGSLE